MFIMIFITTARRLQLPGVLGLAIAAQRAKSLHGQASLCRARFPRIGYRGDHRRAIERFQGALQLLPALVDGAGKPNGLQQRPPDRFGTAAQRGTRSTRIRM